MKKLIPLVFSLLTCSAFADVQVSNAYIRATPPGAPTSAAFMTLKNSNTNEIKLISVQSEIARSTELHTVKQENDTMKMRQVESITIPAAGQVELKPGGNHIMLIGLNGAIKEGQEVMLMLNFSDGSMQHLMLPVKNIMATNSMANGEHSSHSPDHTQKHH
ncbi:MAG: copper chaperone PCu(A)C [Motiliproteus sp.]